MTQFSQQYNFTAKPWQFSASGGWHFVSLPVKLSKEIRKNLGLEEQGWGRLPVTARIGRSDWKTAIWFDTKMNTYLLPLKSEIRKKEQLVTGKMARVMVFI